MSMIIAFALVIGGLITGALCFVTAYVWKVRKYSGIHWSAWFAMGFGSIAISAFYAGVIDFRLHGQDVLILVPFSRFLFSMVLITTAIMALGVIFSDDNNVE